MSNDLPVIKVVSYIRESTLRQSLHGYRPEAQRDIIKAYCERHNFEIVKEFEDSGSGGSTLKRPNFIAMIEFIKSRNDIKFIVSEDNSRFFRNVTETLNYEKELKKKYGIYAVDTRVDPYPRDYLEEKGLSTPQWKFRIEERVKAEAYIRELSINVSQGYERKRSNKLYIGPPAYGLQWLDEHHKFIGYVEEETKIIKEICKLYMTGNYGYQSIATHLNKQGFARKAVKRVRVKKGGVEVLERVIEDAPFTRDIVRSILHNKSYIGFQNTKPHSRLKTLDENNNEKPLEPLINEDDFNYIQQLSQKNRRGKPANRKKKTSKQKNVFLLQGIGYSAVNGCKLYGQTESNNKKGVRVRRYIPKTNTQGTHEHIPSIRADDIEDKIIDLLMHLKINDIDVIEVMLREIIEVEADSYKPKSSSSTLTSIGKLKSTIKSLKDIQKHNYTHTAESLIKDYENTVKELREKTVPTAEEMKYYDLLELRAIFSDISKEFARMQDLSAKRDIVNILFSEFFVGQIPRDEIVDVEDIIDGEDMSNILFTSRKTRKANFEKNWEAKELKALLQKFLPMLFNKIYVAKELNILKISFDPTGLFLLLTKPPEKIFEDGENEDDPLNDGDSTNGGTFKKFSNTIINNRLCGKSLESFPAHHQFEFALANENRRAPEPKARTKCALIKSSVCEANTTLPTPQLHTISHLHLPIP